MLPSMLNPLKNLGRDFLNRDLSQVFSIHPELSYLMSGNLDEHSYEQCTRNRIQAYFTGLDLIVQRPLGTF